MQGLLSTIRGMLMEWYQHLFVGKQAEKNRQSLIDAIEKGDYSGKTWLITLAANPDNQLELMAVKDNFSGHM